MASRFAVVPSLSAAARNHNKSEPEQDRQLRDTAFSPLKGGSLLAPLLLIAASLLLSQPLMARGSVGGHNAHTPTAYSTRFDPDIMDSEWNHHFAGYILIGIAIFVLASHRSHKLTFVKALWPFLFVATGLFLAAWSDKEIWPRGFLSWTWLIHHDAEARQHKIYAVLLLALGVIEYLRWRGKLTHFWRTWAFPFLALCGACLLLVHDHGGNSGLPAGWDTAEKAARIATMAAAAGREPTSADLMRTSLGSEHAVTMPTGHHEMFDLKRSATGSPGEAPSTAVAPSPYHNGHASHDLTPSMLHVKTQHLWFTLVGIAVAIFKFIEDGSFCGKRFVAYSWPSAVFVLGVLLALYTE